MKNINICKRFFNWVQSAPVDFCYVTGEWGGFQQKGSAAPVLSSYVFRAAHDRRPSGALRTPVVPVAVARVGAPVAALAPMTASAQALSWLVRAYTVR